MQAKTIAVLAVAIAAFTVSSYARAADSPAPKAPTVTLSVEGMHCAGCAKKVESKLKAVTGVDTVKIDVKTGTVVVNPLAKKQLSPRILWETVEKAGYTPTKIAGPNGISKEKPKS